MAPLQFKDYVISQRVTRWRIQKEVDEVSKKVNNILNPESKDGKAKNVLHFASHDIGKIEKGDLYKAKSSNQCIQKLIDTVSQTLKKILGLRANLFDKDRNVKSWRSNELKFLDKKKTSLETMMDSLVRTQTSIITNLKLLKRKSDETTEYQAETNRKKKRVQENKRKAQKEKESRLMTNVSEVLKLLTDGKITLSEIEASNETLRLSQLNQTCKMVPRFHSKAIDYLIKPFLFAQDAMAFVQNLSEQMKQKLKDATERNIERKQNNTKRSKQRTLFECLSKENETGMSGDEDADEF